MSEERFVRYTRKAPDYEGTAVFNKNMFLTPDAWLMAFDDYVTWADKNHLTEEKLYGSEGDIAEMKKKRMISMLGFSVFLGIPHSYLKAYFDRGAIWKEVYNYCEEACKLDSLEGAAAGLLKENIVSKIVGLADKVEMVSTQRRVVIMSPDNGRAINAPSSAEDAEIEEA